MLTKFLPILLVGLVIGLAVGAGLTEAIKPAKTVTKTAFKFKKITAGQTRTEVLKNLGTPSGMTQKAVHVTIPPNCFIYYGKQINNAPSWFGIICG